LGRLGYEFGNFDNPRGICPSRTISVEVESRRRGFLGLEKEYEVTAIYPSNDCVYIV